MTPPILSMLPDELRNLYFEQEVAQLSRDLSLERRRANVVRDMNLIHDLNDLSRSVALRATAKSAPSRASSPSIYRAQPQRTRR